MNRLMVALSVALALAGCAGAPPDSGAPFEGPTTAQPTAPATAATQLPTAPAPTTPSSPSPQPTEDPDVTMLAVGDIAGCSVDADESVAELVAKRDGVVALLGDIAYDNGSTEDYRDCFDPAWGAVRERWHPTPGNHEYMTPGAGGYFEYFGEQAAGPGGWYSYDAGKHWRVIVLNSNCDQVGGCTADSPQGTWLTQALKDAAGRHILAYWHNARFSTGAHGSDPGVAPFWEQLHQAHADVILNGHDHVYERFAPQTPAGEPTPDGIRQFTVGTGGRGLYDYSGPPLPTTEVRNNDTYGVLELTLGRDGYAWQFIPAVGTFTDSGTQQLPPP